jgi:CHASE2 domain-containing sensor protein
MRLMKRFWTYLDFTAFPDRRKIHFLINIFVGIFIAVVCHLLEHTDWGEATINRAFDFVVAREAGNAAQSMEQLGEQRHNRISDRIEIDFVEIDHETYKKWGKPLVTRRDELARAIETVYKGGAKVVVVDILFEDKDCCNPEYDRQMRKVLENMTDEKAATNVIFPVRLGSEGDIREHLFGDLIDKNPNFHLAVANFSASPTDKVVRYWVPYEIAKSDGGYRVLWHMSFLAAILAHGKSRELRDVEDQVARQQVQQAHHFELENAKEIELSADRDDLYRNRIRFLLIPPNTLKGHPGGNLFQEVHRLDEVQYGVFRNKIVVIGNTSPDAGDMHATPAGNMAGMYIVGNAINTIIHGIQPYHLGEGWSFLLEAAEIVLAAYLFLYLRALSAAILGVGAVLLIFGGLSYYCFLRSGVFLNFIFPVAGMGFHRAIANIEEIMEKGAVLTE